MRYEVVIEADYLRVEVTGSERAGSAERLLHAVSEAVFQFGKKPILFCAAHAFPLSLPVLYVLARCIINTPLRHCRIALLHDLDRALESSEFIRTLGQDRGLQLAVFRTMPEAVKWLTGRPAH